MSIVVPISTTWDKKQLDQAIKDLNTAKSKLGGVGASSKSTSKEFNLLGSTIKKLGATFAATFSVGAVTAFFKSSIQGAIEDEASLRKLNQTLTNMGFNSAKLQVDQFVGSLQFSAGIADDVLRPALNSLVIATGDLSKSQQFLTSAIDISAGSGRDLDSIVTALSKAYNGNFTALNKLNLGIDSTLIKNKDLNGILDVLNTKFKGAAANAVDTYAGKIKILGLAVGDAQEKIGYALLRALDKASGGFDNLLRTIDETGTEIADIIDGFSILIEKLGLYENNQKSATEETASFFDKLVQGIPVLGTYLTLFFDYLEGLGQANRLEFAPATATPAQSRILRQQREQKQNVIDLEEAEKKRLEAQKRAEDLQKQIAQSTQQLLDIQKDYANFVSGTSPSDLNGALTIARNKLGEVQSLFKSNIPINETLVKNFRELATTIQANFTIALDNARQKLSDIKAEYDSFKSSVKGSITSILNFSSLAEEATFLDTLTSQAEQAKTFGGKIQQLLTLGLSKNAIQIVLDSGFEVGSRIADEIIAGGQTVVNQVNNLVNSVNAVAEAVGTTLADNFYAAGVNAAQNLVNGIINEINRSLAIIQQAMANLSKGTTTQTTSTKKSAGPITTILPPDESGRYGLNRFSRLAKGGIVTGPTFALIGEAGPEAVVPLTGSKAGNAMGGNTYNIVVNAGVGTSGAQVGQQIVEAIKKYERSSGQVFARV